MFNNKIENEARKIEISPLMLKIFMLALHHYDQAQASLMSLNFRFLVCH
jgi:hypothetical protein